MKLSHSRAAHLRALMLLVVAIRGSSFQPLPHQPPLASISSLSHSFTRYNCKQPSSRKSEIYRRNSVRLEASPVLQTLSSPLGSFLVLTGIVLVHECGHYFAARYYGIKVDEFSIGLGPKVTGFEAWGNEFNFRAFPLGGYVRFPENYNMTLVAQQQDEIMKQRRQFRNQRKGKGTLFAGRPKTLGYQIVNLMTLGSLDRKRKEEEEQLNALQDRTKPNPFWKTYFNGMKNQNGKPPKGLPSPENVEIDYYDDPDLLQNRPWFQRVVVLSGGVVFNILLAFLIYFGEITTYGLPQPVFEPGILVSQNPSKDAAASGILRKGDIVLGVNGNSFAMSERPSTAQSQKAINDFIATIHRTRDGDELRLSILRKNDPVEVKIQPKRVDEKAPKTIGVLLSPNYVKTELLKVENPVDAIVPAAKLTGRITSETANALLTFFGTLVMGKDTGGQGVSGPIGLIKSGSDIVATNNLGQVLAFAAAISINLGVVNAFPLPALDGGQLVFVLAEAVTKKKIDQRLQEEIIGVTVLLLILVSISAAVGDVQSLVLNK